MADATGETRPAASGRLRPPHQARVPRCSDHLGRRPARLSRAGRRPRPDRDGRLGARRGAARQEHPAPSAGPAAPGGLWPARRLRRRQRCRAARPRSGDARHRRPGGYRSAGGLDQPDGPLRDRVAGERGEPRGAHGPVRRLDRPGASAPAAGRHHPRHGQLLSLGGGGQWLPLLGGRGQRLGRVDGAACFCS